MAHYQEVVAPRNEEGTKATILKWCKTAGDAVLKDEPLLELETDKVTVEIPSPAAGELAEIFKRPDEEVLPGELLARIRTDAADALAPQSSAAPEVGEALESGVAREAAATSEGRQLLSPAVRRLLRENALRPDDVAGSGRDGRITARDVESRLQDSPAAVRVAHTPIRRRVAAHMVRSLSESPHVTTVFEADLTRVQAHRARHAQEYQRRGVHLTLTAYFVAACARALAANPSVNATYHQDALELHPEVNVGVGTALGNEGLIVPVIHSAQRLGLNEIAERLGRLVAAARAGKLKPEDVRGGTFTLSNHGVSGSLFAAPIVINQPQVAILGVGKVERRVCVLESEGAEAIGIRARCYLTLTIDHRALDAFQANAFLGQVVATLEGWDEAAQL